VRNWITLLENDAGPIVLGLIAKAQNKFGADRLYGGNCGTFAYALGSILKEMGIEFKVGILFNQGRMEEGEKFSTESIIMAETEIYHMVIVIENRIYDGDGEISEQQFVDYAKPYDDPLPGGYLCDFDDRYLPSLIEGETNWSIVPADFGGAMRA
jgi:hypothetical protein